MQQKGGFNYYTSEELQAHIVELPYEGDHVSMVVILPPWLDDGLQQTVKRLTPETLQVRLSSDFPAVLWIRIRSDPKL
jgi:serine protease inhibitor